MEQSSLYVERPFLREREGGGREREMKGGKERRREGGRREGERESEGE